LNYHNTEKKPKFTFERGKKKRNYATTWKEKPIEVKSNLGHRGARGTPLCVQI